MGKKRRITRQTNLKKRVESEIQSESSDESSQEQRIAVKEMAFRHKRGEKMSYLLNRAKIYDDMEEENFWKTNKYFGGENQIDSKAEEEDLSFKEQSSAKMDSFDSDFGKDDQELKSGESDGGDEEADSNHRRKKPGYIKRSGNLIRHQKKILDSEEQVEISSSQQNEEQSAKKWYIHNMYSQEQLIREAVLTEVKNKESLDNLIRLEEEKKRFLITGHRQMNEPRITTIFKKIYKNEVASIETILMLRDFNELTAEELQSCQLLAYLKKKSYPKEKSKQKYHHPKMNKGFTTLKQFAKINAEYHSKQMNELDEQIRQLEKKMTL